MFRTASERSRRSRSGALFSIRQMHFLREMDDGISIHAPHETHNYIQYSHAFHRAARPSCVRQIRFSREMIESISIHAPHEENDDSGSVYADVGRDFNPRLPRKSRHGLYSRIVRSAAFIRQMRFQSTLPTPLPRLAAFTASRAGFSPAQPAPPRPARKTAAHRAPR